MRRFLPIIITVAVAASALAHTFHASLTELELNRDRKTVEVAIRLFSADLETALSRTEGKRVTLDATAGVEPMIVDYLARNLVLRDGSGTALSWKWVGRESDAHSTWVYVEAPWSGETSRVTIANTIFFEVSPDQVNSVNIKRDGKRSGLSFVRGDGAKPLP